MKNTSDHLKKNFFSSANFYFTFTLIVCGIWLRIWAIDRYSYNPDEAFHLAVANCSNFSDLLFSCRFDPGHPPLNFILKHFFLLLGKEELVQRMFGFIPGILCIISFQLIGIAIEGVFLGALMGSICTFSYGMILQSQVSRQYSLLVLFISVAFLFFIQFFKFNRTRDGIVYGILLSLAAAIHYSAYIVICSFAGAGVVELYFRKVSKKKLIEFISFHAPVCLAFLFSYLVHLRFNDQHRETYLYAWSSFHEFIRYQFWDGFGPIQATILIAGFHAVWKMERWVALFSSLLVLFSIVLVLLGLYPIGERHDLFILPVLSLVVSLSLENILKKIKNFSLKINFIRKIDHHKSRKSLIAIYCFMFFITAIWFRERLPNGFANSTEFLTTKEERNTFIEVIKNHVAPGDLVIADHQTNDCLIFYNYFNTLQMSRADRFRDWQWNGAFYFDDSSWYITENVFYEVLEKKKFLLQRADEKSRIWALHLGYYNLEGEKFFNKMETAEKNNNWRFYKKGPEFMFEVPRKYIDAGLKAWEKKGQNGA